MDQQYFGKNIGKMGYGNMRLPKVDGKVDFATIDKMIDTFLEAGYSYFDTTHVYEGSELALGKSLVKRYPREQYQINTKLSFMTVHKKEDMQKQFDTSLERLGLEYIDFYFLHALGAHYLKKVEEFDGWGFLRSLKEKGLAKHIGFSFHGTPELLDEILTEHPEAELVLLQLNYIDWEDPKVQSRRLYETAFKHKIPITVMEPCKGGWLASEISESGKFLKSTNPEVSVASWAFRFLAEFPGIMTILSGMGTVGEVEDNIKTFRDFKPLSEEEQKIIKKAVEIIHSVPSSPCTDCRYCMPHCPKKINIPGNLQTYNTWLTHKNLDTLKHCYYVEGLLGLPNPKECVKCGACEKVCPQEIGISEILGEITGLIGAD